jgi:hypothetical protein
VNEILFDRTPKAFEAERQRSPSEARKNPCASARIFNLIPSATASAQFARAVERISDFGPYS